MLKKRYKNTVPYIPITAVSKEDAIAKILIERRKELVWRGLRWSDIKRLNKIGSEITLKRILNGTDHVLLPNDPRYALPIPDDEIVRSGIDQNLR
ncbi:SusD family protein [compost metagenome]